MQNLNIEVEMMKSLFRGLKGKEAKDKKELICVLIWLKMQHPNSAILRVNTYMLRKWFGVGQKKAERIYTDLLSSDLCSIKHNYDGSVRLWIRSFKSKTKKKQSRKGRKYREGMFCKFKARKDYTLKELYNIVNEMLFTMPISKTEKRGDGKDRLLKSQEAGRGVANSKPIRLKSLASAIGMSASSAARVRNKLAKDGKIEYSPCCDYSEDERNEGRCNILLTRFGAKRPTYKKGSTIHVVEPSRYSIVAERRDRNIRHQFYNYKSSNADKNRIANQKDWSTIPQMMGF